MNRGGDLGERDAERCLICNAEASEGWNPQLRMATDRIRVVSCPNCGFAWREGEEIRTGNTTRVSPRTWVDPGRLSASPEAGIEEMEEIRLFFEIPGSLLNVGGDSSDIIETARIYGWKSQAVADLEEVEVCAEPVPAGPREARPQSGSGTFHVIRLEDVLEYSLDPGGYLQRIAAFLNDKSLLIVNAVDFSRWNFALFGEGSPHLSDPIPRWFFTPPILQTLLERNGFRILKITPYRVPHFGFPQEPAMDTRYPQSFARGCPLDVPAENIPFVSRFRVIAQNAQQASRRDFHVWNYNPHFEAHSQRFELAPVQPAVA